jgi:hypothetical protein
MSADSKIKVVFHLSLDEKLTMAIAGSDERRVTIQCEAVLRSELEVHNRVMPFEVTNANPFTKRRITKYLKTMLADEIALRGLFGAGYRVPSSPPLWNPKAF